MAFVRLPLILTANVAIVLALRLAGYPVGLAAGAVWTTLIVAHFISNLSFDMAPLFFLLGRG